jgi:hypothetical protein
MTHAWTSGLALAALSCAAAHAQTADEIVARHVAARGGIDRIRSVQSLRVRGSATTGSEASVIVSREIARAGRIRLEFTYQGVTSVYASDGQRGWRVSPATGSMDPQPMTPEETQTALEQADLDGPFVDPMAKGLTIEPLGRAAVGGRDAFKFKVTSRSGAVRYHYVDAQSYLLVRTDATRIVRGRPVDVETTFADYRTVGGLAYPHLIESAARNRPVRLRIVVDTVEVDPAIEDARFSPPETAAVR